MSVNQEGGGLWGMFVAIFFITLFVKISLWFIDTVAAALAGEENIISGACKWASKKADTWKEKRKAGKKKEEVKEVTEQK